jgi:phosphinothricin acetyltransferase
MIRPCAAADAETVASIYNHYVRETVVTFEEAPLSAPDMERRIDDVTARFPWLVWEENSVVVGYAYGSPWKQRSAYRFSVETTIYMAPSHTGRGIGTALYRSLLADVRALRFHCAVGCIALPNPASIALHENLGFEEIGRFREVGRKFDRWVDVGYWELIL